MALTKDFKSTIMARAKKDNKFCEAMLSEAVTELLSGDVDAGKAILRDPKSIMRMLSPTGNPTSKSLFMIFHVIQKLKKVQFKIRVS
jgi:hypothetical protein